MLFYAIDFRMKLNISATCKKRKEKKNCQFLPKNFKLLLCKNITQNGQLTLVVKELHEEKVCCPPSDVGLHPFELMVVGIIVALDVV